MSQEITQECRNQAIRYLGRREHSRKELQHKLCGKGFDADLVAALLDSLEKERLLSDARYAEAYIYSRSQKGYGPQRIQQELGERGVDERLVTQLFSDMEVDWQGIASRTRKKKFGSHGFDSWEEKSKQMRFLQYRGFTLEQINRALAENGQFE